MPIARYHWEEPGFAAAEAAGQPPVPGDIASQPAGWVRSGHGVVICGSEEFAVARDALDAWYLANAGRTVTPGEADELYGMCLEGEASLFRPLVWYMARWRAHNREA